MGRVRQFIEGQRLATLFAHHFLIITSVSTCNVSVVPVFIFWLLGNRCASNVAAAAAGSLWGLFVSGLGLSLPQALKVSACDCVS